jgi:spermidine/putrescine transport system permease protein
MVKKIAPYLIILPLIVFLILMLYLPLFIIVRFSLAIKPSFMEPISYIWSIKNYQAFFFNPELSLYRTVLLRTIGTAFIVTFICLIIGYPFAYFLASPRRTLRFKTLFTLLCLFPYLTGYIIRIYAWRVILGVEGVINSFLQIIGLIKEPLSFLLYGPFAVFITLIYLYLPLTIFPIYISLERLDVNWLEAAEDLGATNTQTFLKVTLPLTSPGILVGFLLTFPIITASYIETIMVGGGSLRLMFGNVIQDLFYKSADYPMGSMASIILLIIVVVICILLIRVINIERYIRRR